MATLLQRALDSTLAKLLGLVSTVLAIVVFVVSRPVREALLDAYQADWPVLLALGVAVVAAAWLGLNKRGVRFVTDSKSLQDELRKTVDSAEEKLYCVGSRSRDVEYLKQIRQRVSSHENMKHYRVLFGPPAHEALKRHLQELAKLPGDRVSIGLLDLASCKEPEQSLCASERRAVVIVPQLGAFGAYESAVIITN